MKNKVQQFGKFLSAMVMPNIGALIAFGFLAALFIDTGWIPNKNFSSMVSPMLTYLIPILIAATGGKMVGGDRGRVVAAIAVIGAILSNTEITMLMAAMLVGPLGGFCIKKFDERMDGHMPAGFEMLINNFSVGIFGLVLALLSYIAIGPLMSGILAVLTAGVNVLVNHGLLPLVYMFCCKDKATKQSAPGAVIIHLFGGIHEIYFPYILMNPVVIIAPIVGNMVAIFWFNLMNCGDRHHPDPSLLI